MWCWIDSKYRFFVCSSNIVLDVMSFEYFVFWTVFILSIGSCWYMSGLRYYYFLKGQPVSSHCMGKMNQRSARVWWMVSWLKSTCELVVHPNEKIYCFLFYLEMYGISYWLHTRLYYMYTFMLKLEYESFLSASLLDGCIKGHRYWKTFSWRILSVYLRFYKACVSIYPFLLVSS